MDQDDLPDPAPANTIDALVDNVYPAMALLAAMELDVFSAIHDGATGVPELAAARSLDPERTQMLLDALVAADLLIKKAGRYELTAEAADHLVTSSPWSRVGGHAVLSTLWTAALGTADSLRSGLASHPHDYDSLDPEQASDLLRGLRADAAELATAMADELKLEPGMHLADVGGGAGGAASTFCDLAPGVSATIIELPNIAPISVSLLAEQSRTDISVIEADCTEAVPGNYDRIWAQFVTQTLSPDDAESLINRCAAALSPGGSIHLVNMVVDAERTTPKRAALFNVALLNLYQGGRAHSVADYERWLRGSGMTDIRWTPVNDMIQMVSAAR